MRTVLGVDAGSRTPAEAEHLLLGLADRLGAGPEAVLCTHPVRSGRPHYAVTLDLADDTGPDILPAALQPAGAELAGGQLVGPEAGFWLGPNTSGPPAPQASARDVAAAHAAGTGGRAIRFPGIDRLTGTVPVADVLSGTAVSEVVVLGGGSPDGCRLDTRDFVRPEWRNGRLTLLVLPAGPGLVAPFEVPNPTPCCAGHG